MTSILYIGTYLQTCIWYIVNIHTTLHKPLHTYVHTYICTSLHTPLHTNIHRYICIYIGTSLTYVYAYVPTVGTYCAVYIQYIKNIHTFVQQMKGSCKHFALVSSGFGDFPLANQEYFFKRFSD